MKKEFIPYILSSYPRSGNHWVRYIVEWFSGRVTLGDKEGEHPKDIINRPDKPISQRIKIPHVDNNLSPIAKKRHYINEWDNRDAKLILILRNYRECIVRHLQLSGHRNLDGNNQKVINQMANYMGVIKEYDKWASDKIYLHYEDLLLGSETFEETLKRLLMFMGIYDEKMYSDFISNKDFHKNNSMKTLQAKTKTNGDHTVFHSNKLSTKQRDMWNHLVVSYGDLAKTYLSRYEQN